MPAKIVLYRVDGSCSMAAHILLTELGIPFDEVRMTGGPDGYEAADKSFSHAEYVRDVHPSGYVPALSVDGQIITENPAILRFIGNLAPERQLLGTSPIENAKVDEWLAFLSGTLHAGGFGAYWRPSRFSAQTEMHESIQEKGKEMILKAFQRIDRTVGGKHTVGQKLTVVDVYLHTFYRWGTGIGIDMTQYPKYGEVAREVERLSSLQKIMVEEGQELQFRAKS